MSQKILLIMRGPFVKLAIDIDYWINENMFRMHPVDNMHVLLMQCKHDDAWEKFKGLEVA